jgi:hypothetical protein
MVALMFVMCFFMMKRMSGRGCCGTDKHGMHDDRGQGREGANPSDK